MLSLVMEGGEDQFCMSGVLDERRMGLILGYYTFSFLNYSEILIYKMLFGLYFQLINDN